MKICLPYQIISSLKAGSLSSLPKAFHSVGETFVDSVNEGMRGSLGCADTWPARGWVMGRPACT